MQLFKGYIMVKITFFNFVNKYSLDIKINICNIIECVCRTTIFYENKVAKPKNKKLAEKLFLAFLIFSDLSKFS